MVRATLLSNLIVIGSVCYKASAFSVGNEKAHRSSSLRMSDVAATPGNDIVMINDENMKELLKGGDKPVLIDAMALWCGPCKVIEPVIKRLSHKWDGGIVAKYFVDDLDATEKLREELKEHNCLPKKLPSLILYQGGTPIALRTGLITDFELEEFVSLCSDDELTSIDSVAPLKEESLVGVP